MGRRANPGRIESRKARRGGRYVVSVTCSAAWLDCAPSSDGAIRAAASNLLMHGIGIQIWLDERLWTGRVDLGELPGENWLPFAFELPAELPRAFEGTYVSFRWRIEARRRRGVGYSETSFPLLLREDRPIPTVRFETSPVDTWELRDARSVAERDTSGGACSIRYEDVPASSWPNRGL